MSDKSRFEDKYQKGVDQSKKLRKSQSKINELMQKINNRNEKINQRLMSKEIQSIPNGYLLGNGEKLLLVPDLPPSERSVSIFNESETKESFIKKIMSKIKF